MEGYIDSNKVNIGVTNIKQFRDLLDQADSEMKQLEDTIQQLKRFNLEIEFNFGSIQVE